MSSPADLLQPIKTGLIALGYADNNTPLSFVQDKYYLINKVRYPNHHTQIPYTLAQLPQELQDAISASQLDPVIVQNVQAVQSGEDWVLTWATNNRYTKYSVEQLSVVDGSVIYKRTVNSPTDTFTAAEQRAEYTFLASNLHFKVRGIDSNNVESTQFAEYTTTSG